MLPEREATQVRSLARAAHTLTRPLPLDRILEAAAEEALVALEADCTSVSRVEAGTGIMRTLVNVGALPAPMERWPHDEVYLVEEFAHLRGLVAGAMSWKVDRDDPAGDPGETALLRDLGKVSAVGAPLLVDGELWGLFYGSRLEGGDGFEPDDRAYLEALAAILSGAVSRVLREESLSVLAFHDSLTGLLNRRALDERAALGFQVPRGSSREVTVVVVDINGLKQVNDTRGHHAGDQLIQAVARSLQRAFASLPRTLVARVGGDEFVVLTVDHDHRQVLDLADDLCSRTWDFGVPATVSCGAATVTLTASSTVEPHDVLAAADRAQYVAKHGGLRSTVLADPVEGPLEGPLDLDGPPTSGTDDRSRIPSGGPVR